MKLLFFVLPFLGISFSFTPPLSLKEEPLSFPALPFVGEDGEPFSPSTFQGKPYLVNFMATYCPPCIKEIPSLVRLYTRISPRGEVIGMVLDVGDGEELKAFKKKEKIPFPLFYPVGEEGIEILGIRGLPVSFIVDKDGFIVKRVVGEERWDDERWIRLFETLFPGETEKTSTE